MLGLAVELGFEDLGFEMKKSMDEEMRRRVGGKEMITIFVGFYI